MSDSLTDTATRREAYARSTTHAALARLDVELGLARVDRDLPAMIDAVNHAEAELLRMERFATGDDRPRNPDPDPEEHQ